MNAFIGNHVRFIAEWGQAITAVIILLCLFGIYRASRRFRFFVPQTLASWSTCLVLVPILLVSGLVFARITVIKPGVLALLERLDSMKNLPAPPLDYYRVPDGEAGSLSDFENQVVLVNLWATWCAPCRDEMPELDSLQAALEDQGLVVLAVSDEDHETLASYLDEYPGSFVTGRIEAFAWAEMGNERPITFLVDRRGIVRDIFTGPWDEEFFRRQVEPLL